VIFWIVSIGLAIVSSIYLWYIHQANEVNQKFAHVAENALMDLSGVEPSDDVRTSLPKFVRFHWSYAWQVVTIFLFGLVTACIVLYT
jgi:hypothetical protein